MRNNTGSLSPYHKKDTYQIEDERNNLNIDLQNLDSVPISRSKTGNHSAKVPRKSSLKGGQNGGPLAPGKWSDRGMDYLSNNSQQNRYSQNELYVIQEVSEPSRMISSIPRYTGAS